MPAMHPSKSAAALMLASTLGMLSLGGMVLPLTAVAQSAAPAQVEGAVAAARPPASSVATPGVSASRGAPPKAARAVRQAVTHPLWSELNPAQQQALAPLAPKWDSVSEAQKRKWLAMSQNFPRLAPPEQAKLHSRMTEWVALSPQQRIEARLNFAEAKQLSPDDKKAKWEAYQALPPEEKRKLAAGASKPPPTAPALKPVGPEKLAVVPKPRPRQDAKTPRIAAAPHQVDHNTLLPQPGSTPAPAPVN